MRQIEVVVDKWPIGPQNRMHSKGDRLFIDDNAAFILVGLGKVSYVESESAQESSQRSNKRGRYGRRDMKVQD